MLSWRVLSCFLVSTLGNQIQVTLTGGRKLMINGIDVTSIATAPFVVAILQCSISDGSYYCGKFCSGSLIAPDVVLTAGHCTYDDTSPYGVDNTPRPVSELYILAGATDLYSGQGTLVKVSALYNGGYGLNVRYNMDNDLGLVFLDTCVTIEAGVIETVQVATISTEPDWVNGTCADRTVRTFGFGIKSNLPDNIAADDGIMHYIESVVHSPDICSNAYVDASMADMGYTSALLDEPSYSDYKALYYSTVIADYHLCAGGQDDTATCFGDSGGPMVSNQQVVGITSFGVAEFCGLGPDFLQRIASHSQWISDTMTAHGRICVPVANTFAGAISAPTHSSTFETSRCLTSQAPWQCQWGTCLPTVDVCNEVDNCGAGDTSDEGSPFCSAVPGYTRRLQNEQTGPSSSAELQALIAAYKAVTEDVSSEGSVIIVGSLPSQGRVHNPLADMQLPSVAKPFSFAAVPESTDCAGINDALTSMIAAAYAAADNAAESDPSAFAAACTTEQSCASSNTFTVDTTVDTFCTAFLQFVTEKGIAATLVSSFSSTYGETCLPPSTTSSTTSAASTTSSSSDDSTTNNSSADSTVSVSTEFPTVPAETSYSGVSTTEATTTSTISPVSDGKASSSLEPFWQPIALLLIYMQL